MIKRVTSVARSAVARAGLTIVDACGVEELSVARVAAELEVDVSAVLGCVRNRAELLDVVVELLLEPVRRTADDLEARSWQGYLYGVAQQMRLVALQHPRVVGLVATRPSAALWLWPPLRNLQLVEQLLRTLRSFGLDDHQCAAVYRSFGRVVLGHLLIEVADLQSSILKALPADIGAEHGVSAALGQLRRSFERHSDAPEFDVALEDLLLRIELDLARL